MQQPGNSLMQKTRAKKKYKIKTKNCLRGYSGLLYVIKVLFYCKF